MSIITNKMLAVVAIISRWMDGSLFFRGFVGALNFLRDYCGRSFIAQAFVGDDVELESSLQKSFFVRLLDKILNGFPRFVHAPLVVQSRLLQFLEGSWIVATICEGVGAKIPAQYSAKDKHARGSVFAWLLFAVPAFGIAIVILATPFLPTMMLGGALVLILLLTLISRRFVIDGTAVFLVLFILVSFVVAATSFAMRHSMQIAMITAIFMLSAIVVTSIATSRKVVDFLLLVFIASAGATGLYGMYQVLAGYRSDLWLDQALHADISNRISSSFGNPNVFATYLLLLIPIVAAGIIFFKNYFLKFCALGATALLFGNLMLTYTRGAYVALPLAVIVFVLIMEKRLLILLAALVPFVPLVLPTTVLNRMLSIVNLSDTSTIFRMSIWQGSIRIVGDFWLVGVGQGLEAFHTVYPYYALAAAGTLHSHNLFIQTLVEFGIVGFVLLIAIIACFFRAHANFLRRVKDTSARVMSAAMVAAMVAFLVQGIFDHSFFNYSIMLAFYLFLGLGIAFTRVHGGADNA